MSDRLREALNAVRVSSENQLASILIEYWQMKRAMAPAKPDYKAAREHHRRINEDVDPPYKVVDISGIVDAAIGDRILIEEVSDE